jgi:hypothetical protein
VDDYGSKSALELQVRQETFWVCERLRRHQVEGIPLVFLNLGDFVTKSLTRIIAEERDRRSTQGKRTTGCRNYSCSLVEVNGPRVRFSGDISVHGGELCRKLPGLAGLLPNP